MRAVTLGIALVCLAFPVAAQKLRGVQVGKGVDVTKFKTYEWLPARRLMNSGVVENEPVSTPILKDAINKELAAKGLKEVPSGGELQVSTMILTESSPQLEAMIFAGPYDADWAFGGPITNIGRYNKEGTLAVNLIDPKTKKSAWSAYSTSALGKPSQNESKLKKAVAQMFEHFPPTPKK